MVRCFTLLDGFGFLFKQIVTPPINFYWTLMPIVFSGGDLTAHEVHGALYNKADGDPQWVPYYTDRGRIEL